MKTAFYDFAVSPYSFDYTSFLHCAFNHGCERVVLVPGKRSWSKTTPEDEERRLNNIIRPLVPVIECKTREEAYQYWSPDCYPIGYTVEKPLGGFALHKAMRVTKATDIKPSQDAVDYVSAYLNGKKPVVITLRESTIQPERNSNTEAWVKFGKWLKSNGYHVVLVPDTDAPKRDYDLLVFDGIDIQKRLALYDASLVNMGVNNGPMGLYMYSSRPCLIFKMVVELYRSTSPAFFESAGLPVGSQPYWFNKGQRIIWEDDDFDSIKSAFEMWVKVQNGAEWPERVVSYLPVRASLTKEERQSNMEYSVSKVRERIKENKESGPVSIVGYGTSLLYTWKEIKGDVITVSGAHDFLIKNGIIPKYHLEVDPRPYKADAITPHKDVTYLIASCCSPKLFDKLNGFRVVLWHAESGQDSIDWVDKNDPGIMIGGGSNAGLRACEVAGVLGYKPLHVFGMDSSYMWEYRHAGNHHGKKSKPMVVRCGERQFFTTPAMIEGAREFLNRINFGMEAVVYGDGLLQEMCRQSMKGTENAA